MVTIEMNANGTNSNMASSDQQEENRQNNPDAKLIGREFVRQYYTMLAEHPEYVYRFYSQNSLFIHCDSDAVKGQQDIQKKIQALSLQQCIAKIKKVDACEAPQNGVVIQVLGELSCNGNPGRRFHQTFVLAPQTTKKYYVYNDIFQYADEAFSDPETHNSVAGMQENNYGQSEEIPRDETRENLVNGAVSHEETVRIQAPPVPSSVSYGQQPPLPQRERVDSSTYSFQGHRQTPEAASIPMDPTAQQYRERTESSSHSGYPIQPQGSSPAVTEPVPPQEQEIAVQQQGTVHPQEPAEEGPKTWARIAGKNNPPGAIVTSPPISTPQPPVQNLTEQSELTLVQQSQGQQQMRGSQQGLNQLQPQRPLAFRGMKDLFVGNLPPQINEVMLQQFFSEFGTVLGVRIPRMYNYGGDRPKQPIAFISFDSPSSVKTVLETAASYSAQKGTGSGKLQMAFTAGDYKQWLINVEEKKERGEEGGGKGGQYYTQGDVFRNAGGGEWQGARRQGGRGTGTGGGTRGRGGGGRAGARDDRGRQGGTGGGRNPPRQQQQNF